VTVSHITDQLEGDNFKRYKDSWWRHKRSAESCWKLCMYCIHISVHV